MVAGLASSPAVNALVNYAFPIIGSVLGFILSVTPIRAVQVAEKAGRLGNLNPLPSCMFLANCCIWLLYGAATGDAFIFCANVPSVPVSLHLILHMYPLACKRIRRQMEATVLTSSVLLLFIGMMYVFSPKPATALQLNGTLAMLALLLLYASPLSSLVHVVRARNSASILLPWTFAALGCSSAWFVYGVATHQIPVMVPHCLGMALAVVQLCLRAVFPSRDGGGDSESESSGSDSEEDEEAGQRVVGGAGSPTSCRRSSRGRSRSLSSFGEWDDGLGKNKGKGAKAPCCYHEHDSLSLSRPHREGSSGHGSAGGKRGRSVSAGRATEAGGSSTGSGSGVELMRRMLPLGRPPHRTGSRVSMLQMEDRGEEQDEASDGEEEVVDLEAGGSTRTTPEPDDEKEEDRPPSI